MIRIYCPQDKFRRGGVEHPKGEAFYPADHFSDKALATIEAEKKLAVTTGLKPTGPDMMSGDELKAELKKAKVEFGDTDPRALLLSRLASAQAEKGNSATGNKGGK